MVDMFRACLLLSLAFATAAVLPAQVTYSKEISRILQAKCQQCHRDGDIAPFALDSYDAVLRWASSIQNALATRVMPPWKPKDGFGDFRDSFQLTEDERSMILAWLASGMAEGDPADLPDPIKIQGEWPLGEPDVTLAMSAPYTPPVGADMYRCFVIPTGIADGGYLSAIDVLPGARQVVHHVLMFQDNSGAGVDLDGKDGAPGYPCFGGPGFSIGLNNLNAAMGGWAPGQRTHFLPDGIGIQLQKATNIIIQVHYHPTSATAQDRTRIGLYFSKVPVQQRLFMVPIVNDTFKIPAGEEKYEVNASFTVLPFLAAKAIWVYPHMHLLGRDIKMDLLNSDQSVTPLIWEDNWDFNWQGSYTYKDQIAIPSGSTVRLRCTYDNSSNNLKNPNYPPVAVTWGEQTTDEMCVGFLGVTLDFEKYLPLQPAR
jgi:hypothetical protein